MNAAGRWAVVGSLVAVLVAVPVVVSLAPVSAAAVDAGVLRDRIMGSGSTGYQGYATTQGAMVLPELPQLADVAGLLGGSSSLRVWRAGPQAWRVAVLDAVGEQDTYRTSAGTYTWDYSRNLWTETIGEPAVRAPRAADLVPPELARRLITDAGAGAVLSVLPARRIAGIAAPGLRVAPTDPDTTVRSIDVWADPATGLALAVDVAGAFSSRFLDFSREVPGADLLEPRAAASSGFTATTGSQVTSALNSVSRANLPGELGGRARVPGAVGAVGVYGEGLSRFVVVALPGRLAPTLGVVGSAVLTVVFVRPGRRTYLLAGFVTRDVLTAAAAQLR